MFKAFLSSLLLGLFLPSSAFCATLSGAVHFKGRAPKPELIRMNGDAVCAQEERSSPVYKENLVVNSNGTLAQVFVTVKDYKGPIPPPPTEPVTLDQAICRYVPHVLGVQVGQTLKIINSDPVLHNVHALPKVNRSFNVGMPTKGQVAEKKFTKPEQMIRLKCDVHGWMDAYIGAVEHPFFAVTDKSGNFTIANLPPGEYTIEAWQESLGTRSEKVKVTDAGGKVDFTFGAGT